MNQSGQFAYGQFQLLEYAHRRGGIVAEANLPDKVLNVGPEDVGNTQEFNYIQSTLSQFIFGNKRLGDAQPSGDFGLRLTAMLAGLYQQPP